MIGALTAVFMHSHELDNEIVVAGLFRGQRAPGGMVCQPVQPSHSFSCNIHGREPGVRARGEFCKHHVEATIQQRYPALGAGFADIMNQPGSDRVTLRVVGFQPFIHGEQVPLIRCRKNPELMQQGLCQPIQRICR